MNDLEIFTLNARDNVLLESIKNCFNLTHDQINHEIGNNFSYFQKILKSKAVKYSDLKSVLIPSREKKEAVLVFDRKKVSNDFYGYEIFKKLLPLLDKNSNNSFLCGDYIDILKNQKKLKQILLKKLSIEEYKGYLDSNQFFLVYINNLTPTMASKIIYGLQNFDAFVGSIDVTFGSVFKDYISAILVHSFIRNKKVFIMRHPDDVANNQNINEYGYPFEECGYEVRSLRFSYYDLFLSYKIERSSSYDYSDTCFSISALTQNVESIENFLIKVDDKKLEHLREHKGKILKRLQIMQLSTKELEERVKDKIKNDYIFNLRICTNDGSCLFNVMTEFIVNSNTYKVLIALKYFYKKKQLFLVTMY